MQSGDHYPDPDWLLELTRQLVAEGLCASVHHFTPVRSIYRWHGEVIERAEGRASLHTRTVLVERIVERVKAQHPISLFVTARPWSTAIQSESSNRQPTSKPTSTSSGRMNRWSSQSLRQSGTTVRDGAQTGTHRSKTAGHRWTIRRVGVNHEYHDNEPLAPLVAPG